MAKIAPAVAVLASSAPGKTGLGGDGLPEGAEHLLAALAFAGVIWSWNSGYAWKHLMPPRKHATIFSEDFSS
jgi:hypothetical protein